MKTKIDNPAKPVSTETDHPGFPVRLKAYSQQELCDMYDISRKTFYKWIAPFSELIGKRPGKYFTVLQVRIIFEKLGMPG